MTIKIMIPKKDRINDGQSGDATVSSAHAAISASATRRHGAKFAQLTSSMREHVAASTAPEIAFLCLRLTTHGDTMLDLAVACAALDLSLRFTDAASAYDVVFASPSAQILKFGACSATAAQIDRAIPKKLPALQTALRTLLLNARLFVARLYGIEPGTGSDIENRLRPERARDTGAAGGPESPADVANWPAAYACAVQDSSSLKLTVDIDGFWAHFPLSKAHQVIRKRTVEIALYAKPGKLGDAAHSVLLSTGEFVAVKHCTLLRFATIGTALGKAELLVALPPLQGAGRPACEIDKTVHDLHALVTRSRCVVGCRTPARSRSGDGEQQSLMVTATLPRFEYAPFFAELAELLDGKDAFLFLCSFGNKKYSISAANSCGDLGTSLADALCTSLLPSLTYDICVTVSAGHDALALANDRFFAELGIAPTHVLFFCDSFRNHNKKVVRVAKSGQLRFGRCFYSKLNCYSTVEDALADERRARLVPRYAVAMLREQLHGRLLVAKRGVG
ncbi:hypothetical protein PAPHI01_2689, partial [Pancytospora philotis]